MGKYDDAIGGGEIVLSIKEILDETSANQVDQRIKQQKKELEKPIKPKIDIKDAEKQLNKLNTRMDELKEAKVSNKNKLSGLSLEDDLEEVSRILSEDKSIDNQIKKAETEVSGIRKQLRIYKSELKTERGKSRKLSDEEKTVDKLLEANKTKKPSTKKVTSDTGDVAKVKEKARANDELAASVDKVTKSKKESSKATSKVDTVDATKKQVKANEELADSYKKVEKAKKTIEKSDLLKTVEILEDREEIADARTSKQKRDAAERIVKNQYNLLQEMKEIYDSGGKPSKKGNVYDVSYEDILAQQSQMEAYIALYDKYGGSVEKLGKRIKQFSDENGFTGSYQYNVNEYEAQIKAAEGATQANEKLAASQKEVSEQATQIPNTSGTQKQIDKNEELIASQQKVQTENEKTKESYKSLGDIIHESAEKVLDDLGSTGFGLGKDIPETEEALRRVEAKIAEIKDEAVAAGEKFNTINDTIKSYTGINLSKKSDFQNAIKDQWKKGNKAAAAKLFEQYQLKFPDGKFNPEKVFGAEWSNNFSANLEQANRDLAYFNTQLINAAEAYGKFVALQRLDGERDANHSFISRKALIEENLDRLKKAKQEEDTLAEKSTRLTSEAKERFATNDPVTAQENLNQAINEYNSKQEKANALLQEFRRLQDLDDYEDEPWFNENESPIEHIMAVSKAYSEAQQEVDDFKVSLKEAVQVYRGLGGDMKLPFEGDLLKEIDSPIKVATQSAEKGKKTLKEFMSLFNELSTKSGDKDAFGQRYAYLLEGISGANPTIEVSAAYDELIQKETEYQSKQQEQARITAERATQMQAFTQMISKEYPDIYQTENAKLVVDLLNNISQKGLSASDAMEQLKASMGDIGAQKTIKGLVDAASKIPQAENTIRVVHFTNSKNNQSILENGLYLDNQRLGTSTITLKEYEDALRGVGNTLGTVLGVAQQYGASGNAIILDIPNDSVLAYTASVGNLESVSNEFVKAVVNTENGLIEVNQAYNASHDVISEYTDAIEKAREEENQSASARRRPGMKQSDALETVKTQIEQNRMPIEEIRESSNEIDQLRAKADALGEEFKNSQQYKDFFAGIESGSIKAEDALNELDKAFESFKNRTKLDKPDVSVENALPALSVKELSKAFDAVDLGSFFKFLNIDDSIIPELKSMYAELLQLYKLAESGVDVDDKIDATFTNIIDTLMRFGSTTEEVHNEYKEFDKCMQGVQLAYTPSDRAEFGDNWSSIKSRFSKQLVPASSGKGIGADVIWKEISELFPHLFSSEIINEKDQLKAIIYALGKARDAKRNGGKILTAIPDSYRGELESTLAKQWNTMVSASKLEDEATALDNVEKKATSAANAKEKFTKANQKLGNQAQDSAGDVEEETEALERQAKAAEAAADKVSDAKKNINSQGKAAFLTGTTLADFEDYAKQIAADNGMTLGAVNVLSGSEDNVMRASVQLLNKELAQSMTYTYTIMENADGMAEAFLTSTKYAGNIDKALKNASNAQKKADKERLQNQTWIIQQNKKLDTQTRSYKNSKKTIDGSLELMSVDSSLPDNVNKTIDNLAEHIRKRLQDAISSGTLTDTLKAEILNDLRILENEIKVRQNEKYSATNMKASSVKSAKEGYEYVLNTLESRAKKANVFGDVEQDLKNLRDELKTVSDSNGLNKFIDNLRTAQKKLTAVTAEQAQNISKKNFELDLDRQVSLLTKQQAQWEKNGQLTDKLRQKINEMFESLTKVTNSSELSAWKKQWAIVKDEVMETKYQIEATNKAQKEKIAERKSSGAYWDKEFNYALNNLIAPEKRPELEQLKQYMLQQAASTKENIMEQYDAIFTIISNKNKALSKLMSAKGAEEQKYWQDQYSAWFGAWNQLDPDAVNSFFEDVSNQAIIGEVNIKKFNDALEESKRLAAQRQDKTNKDAEDKAKSEENAYKSLITLQNKLFVVKKQLAKADIDSAKSVETQRKVTELQEQYDKQMQLAESTDYYNKLKDREIALEKELSAVIDEVSQKQDAKYGTRLGSVDIDESVIGDVDKLKMSMMSLADKVSDGKFELKGFNDAGTEMYGVMKTGANSVEEITVALKKGSKELVAYKGETKNLATFWQNFKSSVAGGITQFAAMYLGFNDIIRYARQGVEYVREIDLAMTELKKVTDETEQSYANFLNTASKTAGTIGSTVKDFTEVTSDFARLGYSLEEATDLAKTALIYENVGDGFNSVSEASESIISTMKAFKIEAQDTMSIVDKFNEVGNILPKLHSNMLRS